MVCLLFWPEFREILCPRLVLDPRIRGQGQASKAQDKAKEQTLVRGQGQGQGIRARSEDKDAHFVLEAGLEEHNTAFNVSMNM